MNYAINTKQIIILSGPSGVGKDAVLEAWTAQNPSVERVIAATTRAPRTGETDGKDYHFYTEGDFVIAAENGEFLEHKLVHGNWYATPYKEIERIQAKGGIVVLKIDVQGAEEVVEKFPDVQTIFILPPSDEELERRIRGRGTDSEEAIEHRLRNAKAEIAASHFYRHKVVNDTIPEVVAWLEDFARGLA